MQWFAYKAKIYKDKIIISDHYKQIINVIKHVLKTNMKPSH